MADDTGLDLDSEEIDQKVDNKNKVEERMINLSTKAKDAEGRAEEAIKLAEDAKAAKEAAETERDFFSSFTDATAKFPGANEHKDAILEKVKTGYSVEDATLVVMNALPKDESETEATVEDAKAETPAGGSAVNPPEGGGPKSIEEMTQDERLEALKIVEQKGGISLT